MKYILLILFPVMILSGCRTASTDQSYHDNLYTYNSDMEPRWVSFENMKGEKGAGGMENHGAKGHACDSIAAGAKKVVLNVKGRGIINRMWFTISDRSPEMLRSLLINIYWDDQEKPAVSVPFGDFFGVGLGRTAAYENAL